MGRREIIGNTLWPVPAQLSQKVKRLLFIFTLEVLNSTHYALDFQSYHLRSMTSNCQSTLSYGHHTKLTFDFKMLLAWEKIELSVLYEDLPDN